MIYIVVSSIAGLKGLNRLCVGIFPSPLDPFFPGLVGHHCRPGSLYTLSCSVAPFSLFLGGCPTKNGPSPQKGFPFFQPGSLNN